MTASSSMIETAWRLAQQQQPEQALKLLAHNPFMILAYGVFFLTLVVNEFKEFKYNPRIYQPDQRFSVSRQNWKDPVVKIYWVGLTCTLLLFLLGSLQFRSQLK